MQRTFNPYRHQTLQDYEIFDVSQKNALLIIADYMANLDSARSLGRGLTLLGPNGVGKTMLASIVLNEAQARGYRIESIELSSYVGLHKERFGLQQLLRTDDDMVDAYVKIRHHIRFIQGQMSKGADWVLFDDVGREFPSESGWSQNEFFDTLRFRWNRGLPFLLTTNLPMADLEHRYTEGFVSLLGEATQIIEIIGDDYRWKEAS